MGSRPRWWPGEIRWYLGSSDGEVVAPATWGDVGHLLPFLASSISKRECPRATATSSSGRRTRGRCHAVDQRMTPAAPPRDTALSSKLGRFAMETRPRPRSSWSPPGRHQAPQSARANAGILHAAVSSRLLAAHAGVFVRHFVALKCSG